MTDIHACKPNMTFHNDQVMYSFDKIKIQTLITFPYKSPFQIPMKRSNLAYQLGVLGITKFLPFFKNICFHLKGVWWLWSR